MFVRFTDHSCYVTHLRQVLFVARSICYSHTILSLDYNCTGENILIVGGNARAKVLDRDGHEVMTCVKGYQYIVDTASTDVSIGI